MLRVYARVLIDRARVLKTANNPIPVQFLSHFYY